MSGQGVSSWSAHGLVAIGAGVGLGVSGKRGGLSGGARSWGARAGLVSGLTNSVQNPCVKRRGLCGESWLGLGSGGVLNWAQNIFSCSPTSLVNQRGPCIEGGRGQGQPPFGQP